MQKSEIFSLPTHYVAHFSTLSGTWLSLHIDFPETDFEK